MGGGSHPRPGEVSLAHHGVLFLDEMPEFPRSVLETLRQPMEDGQVTIARAHGTVRFPAQFQLVAAMNPTPKGDKPTDDFSQRQMDRYLVEAERAPDRPHRSARGGAAGALRAAQRRTLGHRFGHPAGPGHRRPGGAVRAQRGPAADQPDALSGRELDRLAPLPPDASELLKQAMTDLGLSARAYDKVRRVARTIADLEQSPEVALPHVAEAIQYRLLDRK